MKLTLNAKILKEKELRDRRAKLLDAFDIYKSNIAYKAITETADEHKATIQWYHDILDLKEEAFDRIPEKVAQYL